NVTFARGGTNANPITLTAAPGAHPVLKGVLTIPDTTDYIAIADLALEGADAGTTDAGAPAPAKAATLLVRGDHVALRNDDITSRGNACATLGAPAFGVAELTVIDGARIHGCASGVVARRAESGLVTSSFIYDNTATGVAFNPNGTSFTVEHDVIDGNGSGVL